MSDDVRTADLCDAHGERVRVLAPGLLGFGGRRRFAGPVRTVRVLEDNVLVRQALSEPGAGAVLVVDGGGSLRCALLGDVLGALAVEHGWTAVVVAGAVRDAAALATLDLGVLALGTCPRKSTRRGEGARDEPIELLGTRVVPGMWIFADEDGVLLSDGPLA